MDPGPTRYGRLLVLLLLAAVLATAAGAALYLRSDGAAALDTPGDAPPGSVEDESGVAHLRGRGDEGDADAGVAGPVDEAHAVAELAEEGKGVVKGRIVGPDGRPVPGATAGYAIEWDGTLDSAPADAMGYFELVQSVGRAFTVIAVAPGHGIALGPRVVARIDQMVDVGTLRLEKGSTISGRVVDPRGEPAEGVELAVETEADPVPERWVRTRRACESWHSQRTDVSGHFAFDHLPEGVYRVMVAYGESDTWDEVRQHVPTGTDDLRFVAPAPVELIDGRIRVRAVGPDGEPIPRFQARIDDASGGSGSTWAAGGELEIGSEEMAAPVQLTVWDAHDDARNPLGYGVAVVRGVKARDEPYVVRLVHAGHVAGRVVWSGEPRSWLLRATGRLDTEGRLARGSRPDVWDLPTIQLSTKSDPSGAFRFVGLPPGEIVIRLESGGSSFSLAGNSVVTEVGRDDVVLHLVATGTIRVRLHAPEGKVIRWGAARLAKHVAGGLARAGSSTAGSSNAQSFFDFAFEGVDLEGRYRLESEVVAAGRTYAGEVLDEITPREERYDVHVDEGLSIAGRVVRRDGTSVPGVEVHYRPHPAGFFFPGGWLLGEKHYTAVTTERDGTFVLTGLDPGEFVLTVVAPGLSLDGAPPRVSTGTRGLSLAVAPAWRISGNVEDEMGERVDALRVTAVPAAGEIRLWTPHEVLPGGFFEVQDLHEGTWRIVGWCGDLEGDPRYVLSEPVSAGTKDVRLDVRRGCAVAGVVRAVDGAAIPGATVHLVGPWTHRGMRTGAEGEFAFAGVAPGSYAMEVRTPVGKEARRTFTAVAGVDVLEVDVVVP